MFPESSQNEIHFECCRCFPFLHQVQRPMNSAIRTRFTSLSVIFWHISMNVHRDYCTLLTWRCVAFCKIFRKNLWYFALNLVPGTFRTIFVLGAMSTEKLVFCHCPWLIEWIRVSESDPVTIWMATVITEGSSFRYRIGCWHRDTAHHISACKLPWFLTESRKFSGFDANTQAVMMRTEWILPLSVLYIVVMNMNRNIVMVQERCITVMARIGSQRCSVTGNPCSARMARLDVIPFMDRRKTATFWKMVRVLYPMITTVCTSPERPGKNELFVSWKALKVTIKGSRSWNVTLFAYFEMLSLVIECSTLFEWQLSSLWAHRRWLGRMQRIGVWPIMGRI